jgi:bifunctional enzyme CysN/CysC
MERSPNVTWQASQLTRERRWRELGTSGATLWLTGLSGAGKSTLAAAVEERLVQGGQPAYLLDGDNMRHGLCADLGFSTSDRRVNIRRVGEVAQLFADAGMVAVVALISPIAAARDEVRDGHRAAGLRFYEVFVDTPLEVCAARDSKGLYARARAGGVRGFTGVDDPYEPPTSPDLHLIPGMALTEAVDAVLSLLIGRQQGAPR